MGRGQARRRTLQVVCRSSHCIWRTRREFRIGRHWNLISADHLTLASLQGQSLSSSLQGQSLSSIGTTNTYSTNSNQSIKEDVSQLLRASQPLTFSFQRQISVLRK